MTRESDHILGMHEFVEGFELRYNRGSNEFSAGHTISMGEDSRGYQFTTTATAGNVRYYGVSSLLPSCVGLFLSLSLSSRRLLVGWAFSIV
jgi:hypothetical protein